jgi:hypothetical protein
VTCERRGRRERSSTKTNEGPIAPRFARVVPRRHRDPKHLLHPVVLGIAMSSRHGSPARGSQRPATRSAAVRRKLPGTLRSSPFVFVPPFVNPLSPSSPSPSSSSPSSSNPSTPSTR